jgi:hypothetical protein
MNTVYSAYIYSIVRSRTKATELVVYIYICSSTQNHWISGICPSTGIVTTMKYNFRKLDLFPSSGEGRETPTLLGPLERDNLNHWTSDTNRNAAIQLEIISILVSKMYVFVMEKQCVFCEEK